MLIDEFLPEYDFEEIHDIRIRAGRAIIYRLLPEIDFSESAIIRFLLRLRGMSPEKMTLRGLRKFRFEMLGETAEREILMGLAGRFWTIRGDLQSVDVGNFKEFKKKGFAKAVWNFSLEEHDNETTLTTETRIKCLDTRSRKSFGFYWTFIRPFSGLIRMEMLKTIKRRAEAGT